MGLLADLMDFAQKYLISKNIEKKASIPAPSFNFLMGLGLVLAVVWCLNVPGSLPLS